RLVAAEHRKPTDGAVIKSGLTGLDNLLGGGISPGSSTLIAGPSGTGKSLLILQYICAAVERGEGAAWFVFDEELGSLFRRAKGIGVDLEAMAKYGKLFIEQVDAAEISPGEFTHRVRSVVDHRNIYTVAIDSLNGFQAAMPEEQHGTLHL